MSVAVVSNENGSGVIGRRSKSVPRVTPERVAGLRTFWRQHSENHFLPCQRDRMWWLSGIQQVQRSPSRGDNINVYTYIRTWVYPCTEDELFGTALSLPTTFEHLANVRITSDQLISPCPFFFSPENERTRYSGPKDRITAQRDRWHHMRDRGLNEELLKRKKKNSSHSCQTTKTNGWICWESWTNFNCVCASHRYRFLGKRTCSLNFTPHWNN